MNLRNKIAELRKQFSLQTHHPKLNKNPEIVWHELNLAEQSIRHRAKAFKPDLEVSRADIEQVAGYLPPKSALVEFLFSI